MRKRRSRRRMRRGEPAHTPLPALRSLSLLHSSSWEEGVAAVEREETPGTTMGADGHTGGTHPSAVGDRDRAWRAGRNTVCLSVPTALSLSGPSFQGGGVKSAFRGNKQEELVCNQYCASLIEEKVISVPIVTSSHISSPHPITNS